MTKKTSKLHLVALNLLFFLGGCTSKDDFSILKGQWQYYNSGTVVEIGIDDTLFYYWTNEDPYNVLLRKCEYDSKSNVLNLYNLDDSNQIASFPGSFYIFDADTNYIITGNPTNKFPMIRVKEDIFWNTKFKKSKLVQNLLNRHSLPPKSR